MADKIKIISIELNNYRQYYGKQKVEFSSRKEGFTTLIGENGEGKSNLLNAINWCFYQEEPHGKKDSFISTSVINSKYLIEQGKGKQARTSVKIILQKGTDQYSISRVLTISIDDLEYEKLEGGSIMMTMAVEKNIKLPRGCHIVPDESNFKIKKRQKNESDFHEIDEDYNHVINQILPIRLSVFFLLDGEFLEKFWDSFDRVEEGIEQISQLHLLNSCIDHVGNINVKRISLNDSSEESRIQKLLIKNYYYEKSLDEKDGNILFSHMPRWAPEGDDESDEMYHATGLPRIKDFEHDIQKMQRRQQDITRSVYGINLASVKVLQEEYARIEKSFQRAKNERKKFEDIWRNNLIEKSPYVFAKKALETSIQIVEKHIKLGELPNETKKIFTNDLLERDICICKNNLTSKKNNGKEMNLSRIAVEEARDTISEDLGLDRVLKMKYKFKDTIIDNYNEFLIKTFSDPYENFRNAKDDEDTNNRNLKGIKDKLGNAGDNKIRDLIAEQDRLSEKIKSAVDEKNSINSRLANNANENDENKQKLIRLAKKNKKLKKSTHYMKIWDKSKSQLQEIYDVLKKEIRIEVQKRTWKIFKQILYESDKFKEFTIRQDYSVILLNKENQNHIVDISAGQSLFLAIAFVTALREITGYKFPLLIDTPLGKISGSNKYNLAKILPTYLEHEQIIFLATDTEWVTDIPNISRKTREKNSFGELVNKQIPVKLFRIKQDDNGCSSINTAKLENGEIKIV